MAARAASQLSAALQRVSSDAPELEPRLEALKSLAADHEDTQRVASEAYDACATAFHDVSKNFEKPSAAKEPAPVDPGAPPEARAVGREQGLDGLDLYPLFTPDQ